MRNCIADAYKVNILNKDSPAPVHENIDSNIWAVNKK